MSLLMNVSTVVSILNVAVLLILFVIYAKIYVKSRAVFTIGLMFFTVMLMLHNLIAVYAYLVMAPLYPDELLPYFVAIHIAELVGIVSLLRVTI
ncbi:MAG: hypothetical protein E6L04_00940 [Thaumarchaeota archaeon]|nr:MAG: hypothetical protein E6L04_00940 [Nitrososphaerota archaeon]